MRIISREGMAPRVSGFSLNLWSSRCSFLAQKYGWSHTAWARFWGGVPEPGGATIDREAPVEMDIWKMGIHLGGGSKRGGEIQGDGRIN